MFREKTCQQERLWRVREWIALGVSIRAISQCIYDLVPVEEVL